MAYVAPAYNNIIIRAPDGVYTLPAYSSLLIGLTGGIGRKALYLDDGFAKTIPDALLGTGIKPYVLLESGEAVIRSGAEGTPLVMLDGEITTLPSSDYLII